MSELNSISNNQIKYFRSLQQKKYRNQHNRFLIEGRKMVKELVSDKNGFLKVKRIIGLDSFFRDLPQLMNNFDCLKTDQKNLDRISSFSSAFEAIAELEIPDYSMSEAVIKKSFNFYFESVRDPGNLGTIIRTADWFGISHIFCSPDSVDFYNPKVVQSTMGSISRIRLIYMEREQILDLVDADPEFISVAAKLNGENMYDFQYPLRGVLFFGNESKGLSNEILDKCEKGITIPSFNSNAESLNLSVSAAIVMADLKRGIIRNES